MRIALGVAYEGNSTHGWQSQGSLRTVQAELEYALAKVAAHPIRVTAAGRTDQGVHALGQVVHFDTAVYRSTRSWVLGSNQHLSPDIRVLWAKPVSEAFHARFSAIARHYCYIIYQSETIALPWFRHYALWHRQPLSLGLMQEAANLLVGKRDFSAFQASSCESKSSIRQIYQLIVSKTAVPAQKDFSSPFCREEAPAQNFGLYSGNNKQAAWIEIHISANAFLQHMVRNIVGVLLEVGEGRRSVDSLPILLASKDRQQASVTAKPQGLYLKGVDYPAACGLPT
jgi:tRNA pseudouridine38-40 synthase